MNIFFEDGNKFPSSGASSLNYIKTHRTISQKSPNAFSLKMRKILSLLKLRSSIILITLEPLKIIKYSSLPPLPKKEGKRNAETYKSVSLWAPENAEASMREILFFLRSRCCSSGSFSNTPSALILSSSLLANSLGARTKKAEERES